jgi:hypothetical protein
MLPHAAYVWGVSGVARIPMLLCGPLQRGPRRRDVIEECGPSPDPLPNFTLQLTRPVFGPPPTPPPSSAERHGVTPAAGRVSRSRGIRGSRRAAATSARGTGRAAEREIR